MIISSPEGIFTIDMPSMQQPEKEKIHMIDSVAAISVATYASFREVKLDKCGGNKYKL